MTEFESTHNSNEHVSHEWQRIDRFVKDKIAQTAQFVEYATPEIVQEQIALLNNFFKSESMIGLDASLTSGMPLFIGKQLTSEGVTDYSIIDKNLIGNGVFYGTFQGCVAQPIQADKEATMLMFDIAVDDHPDGLHIQAPAEFSELQVKYPTLGDTWEENVDGAFSVLETIEDDELRGSVDGLMEAFWNTDQPLLLRIRTIGLFAIEIAAHKEVADFQEAQDALDTILDSVLEDELLYSVQGLQTDEIAYENGESDIDTIDLRNPLVLKPHTISWMSNFEITGTTEGEIDIEVDELKQPVLVFIDPKHRVTVNFPWRYITHIEEHEFDHTYGGTVRTVGRSKSVLGQYDGVSCGEWSLAYQKEQENR